MRLGWIGPLIHKSRRDSAGISPKSNADRASFLKNPPHNPFPTFSCNTSLKREEFFQELSSRNGQGVPKSMMSRFFSVGVSWVTLILLLPPSSMCAAAAPPSKSPGNSSQLVKPNRTLPVVQPPSMRLEFSAQPTVQEIMQARVFEEPLVPIGGEPVPDENSALATALLGYSNRSDLDDFYSLTGFLEKHPQSPWRAALLTDLGLEYFKTARYSKALTAWQEAWSLGQNANNASGKLLADRAACELAGLYSRLGRMTELEALLKSVEEIGRAHV